FEAVVVTTGRVPLAGERPFVPDHKVYFADFDDENTSYFVCAMLNSAMVKEYIESHTIQIQVSNIFKHMSIPRFKAADARHTKIVDLCKKAHLAKNDASRAEILDEMNKLSEEVLTGKKATKG
ncbi:PBP1b-binding outer membrane lipoprotein LpoB, partial [Chelatococcus composti]|nr:PBP1b-binding outer membrane lipoprotein LpoB [Chelatococcus composti]